MDRQLLCVKGDLRQADDLRSFVNQAVERFGGVDVLVNNAGIDLSGPLEDYSDADVQRLIDINLTGAIKLTREVLPHLQQPGGVIVNVASATGLGGNALQSVYSASKAALLGFTHSLAMELLDRKQRVVAIAPGTVLTPMSRRYLGDLSVQGLGSALDRAERTAKALPLGIGMPDDVANAVAFLASDEARWISGITLPIGYCPTYSQPID